MRTFEEIKTELEKWKKEKIELENEIDRASPTAFDYLNDLDKELYKTHCMIDLLEWVLVEEEDRLKIIWDRQKMFDDIVLKKRGKTKLEVANEIKVALITEIGELYNENPTFKFWKEQKKYRNNR